MATSFDDVRFSGNDQTDASGSTLYLYKEPTPAAIPTTFGATGATGATFEGSTTVAPSRDQNGYNYAFNVDDPTGSENGETYFVVNSAGTVITYSSVGATGAVDAPNGYMADNSNGQINAGNIVRRQGGPNSVAVNGGGSLNGFLGVTTGGTDTTTNTAPVQVSGTVYITLDPGTPTNIVGDYIGASTNHNGFARDLGSTYPTDASIQVLGKAVTNAVNLSASVLLGSELQIGAAGATGATGSTGATGGVGATGPTGATGAASTVPGPTGATGAASTVSGPTGSTGQQGITGAAGATGAGGPAGGIGGQGPVGATGAQGSPGPTGPAGATGTQGTIGATGPMGATGPQGIPGPKGTSGDAASIGIEAVTATQNADGTTTYQFTGGSYFHDKSYSAVTDTRDAGGALLSESRAKNDGQTATSVYQGGQTLVSGAFDTFYNNGAPDTTFVFNPGFGRDVVSLFRVDGTDHDILSFMGSDFGTTPTAQLASVLSHSKDTAAGLLITDPTASSPGGGPGTHDTLLLKGITKDQFAQYQNQDITFHA